MRGDQLAEYEADGRKVRRLRELRGMERAELAEQAGISYSFLCKVEVGARQAGITTVRALAKCLGTDYTALLAVKQHALAEDEGDRRQCASCPYASNAEAEPEGPAQDWAGSTMLAAGR